MQQEDIFKNNLQENAIQEENILANVLLERALRQDFANKRTGELQKNYQKIYYKMILKDKKENTKLEKVKYM